MEGREHKRGIGLAAALAVSLVSVVLLLAPGQSGALETNDGCPNLDPNVDISRAHTSATDRPLVFFVGDSISAHPDQRAIYAQKNWDLHRWRTIVIAHGGAKIDSHRCLNWKSFYYAAHGDAKAVVIELGTNDIFQINDGNAGSPPPPMDPNRRLVELSKVFTEMNWVGKYMHDNHKCVVWVGLNHYKDSIANDKDTALAFDKHLQDLHSTYANIHYASYATLVRDSATFYRSLYGPDWADHPEYGRHDTIHPLFPGKFVLGDWVTRQVDNFCI
jgi:hypothetical protein